MGNQLEIIVHLKDNKPKIISFEDLYAVRGQMESIVFLWNTNSYYVSILDNTIIVNGGRKIHFKEMGNCNIEYRKRSTFQYSTTGDHEPRKDHKWLFGLRNENKEVVLLEVASNGKNWTLRYVL